MTSVRDENMLAEGLVAVVAGVLGSQPGCRVTHEDGVVLTGACAETPRAGRSRSGE